jgi:hypothetical protein
MIKDKSPAIIRPVAPPTISTLLFTATGNTPALIRQRVLTLLPSASTIPDRSLGITRTIILITAFSPHSQKNEMTATDKSRPHNKSDAWRIAANIAKLPELLRKPAGVLLIAPLSLR